MWCQVHAGLAYRRWPGWAPAGALANFLRRGSSSVRLNYEELSLSYVCVGLCVTVTNPPCEQESPADYVHSPSV